jgi:pimeloyl-ACP methyl ester carboxylesterase
MTATVVLVHGAWHGAWCWDRVVPRLRDRGLEVVAVDLPGHGDDPGPLTDLHGDAARVRAVIDELDGPVVLVGHSYGGVVVTEAGTHPAVEHLVYLAAFAINDQESCGSAGAGDPALAMIDHSNRPDLGALMVIDDGVVTLRADGADEVFYNDCDAPTAAAAVSRLGPQRLDTLTQTPTAVAWQETASTYVVCTADQAVHPDLQRLLAARCTETAALPTSHSPFLSRPDLVAGLLAERANRF